MMVRNPGFSVVVVLTLALGIGANTAIFGVVNGVLLRPLPFERSERLVRIAEHLAPGAPGGSGASAPRVLISRSELEALHEAKSLSHVGVYGGRPFSMTLATSDGPIRLSGERVSADVLPMLMTQPALGRVFEPKEQAAGADGVIMLSDTTWRRYFQARPDIVGRILTLDAPIRLWV